MKIRPQGITAALKRLTKAQQLTDPSGAELPCLTLSERLKAELLGMYIAGLRRAARLGKSGCGAYSAIAGYREHQQDCLAEARRLEKRRKK